MLKKNDRRDLLETRMHLAIVLDGFIKCGTNHVNPYTLTPIKNALKFFARSAGWENPDNSYLDVDLLRIAHEAERTLDMLSVLGPEKTDQVLADLGTPPIASVAERVGIAARIVGRQNWHAGGMVPLHESGRIGENPVRGLPMSIFPIRFVGQSHGPNFRLIKSRRQPSTWEVWECVTSAAGDTGLKFRRDLTVLKRGHVQTAKTLRRQFPYCKIDCPYDR